MNEKIIELAKKCGYWSGQTIEMNDVGILKFAELIIEEAAKEPLCDSDGVVGKYSDSDRYYFETLMKKQLGLI
jgi:hypothetical protein